MEEGIVFKIFFIISVCLQLMSLSVFARQERYLGDIGAVERVFEIDFSKCERQFVETSYNHTCKVMVEDDFHYETLVSRTLHAYTSANGDCIVAVESLKNGYAISASIDLSYPYPLVHCARMGMNRIPTHHFESIVYTLKKP